MLAKSLGAKVKVVYSQTVALGLDEWCKNQDVTKLIIGHILEISGETFSIHL